MNWQVFFSFYLLFFRLFSFYLGQSQNRPNKKIVREHKDVTSIRASKYYELTAVKLVNENSALVSYKPLEDRIKPYKYGCLVVSSLVTAFSRIYLTR